VTTGLSETVCIGVTKIGCTPSGTEEDEGVDEEVLVEVEVPEEVTGTACSVRILRSLDADERISLRDVLGGAAVTCANIDIRYKEYKYTLSYLCLTESLPSKGI
jgi:hypothetical protein